MAHKCITGTLEAYENVTNKIITNIFKNATSSFKLEKKIQNKLISQF